MKKQQHIFYNISNSADSLPVDIDKFIDTSKQKFSEMYKVGIDEVYIDTIDICARIGPEGGYLCTLILTTK